MKIRKPVGITLAVVLLTFLLSVGAATAKTESSAPPQATPSPTLSNPFWEKLELLREDKQLQKLVEEDLEKSIAIREQIQTEVDRAFGHTTTILNVLLVLLTSFPILAAAGIWFIRRSVISQIVAETRKQLQEEVEKQLEEEVAAEFKKQTEAFKQEIERLKSEFVAQLSQLNNLFLDAQKEKDKIIQELSQITPSPVREPVTPEIQQKIQELTKHLELLKAANPQLFFTANDYVEQGKALYFEGRYDDAIASHDKAIQIESDNPRAWFSKGAVLTKLQQYQDAIACYDRATQIKLDFSEAWFGRGTALAKLQQYPDAIASYDQVIQIKPDFYLAWFGKARCHALQGDIELAIENLQQAINLNADKCRETAKTDPSFDNVREEERFKQLIWDTTETLS
ncbi:MAG TPA: tetratricopeptide repeat protein [Leptolyngbyaceae cyanobacterium]